MLAYLSDLGKPLTAASALDSLNYTYLKPADTAYTAKPSISDTTLIANDLAGGYGYSYNLTASGSGNDILTAGDGFEDILTASGNGAGDVLHAGAGAGDTLKAANDNLMLNYFLLMA